VDAVVLMLPNSVAVEEVLIGKGGLLELLPRGSLVIDMGSSRPSSTTRLAQLASTRGISLIDAPVSGGVAKANVGELSIMVGTDKDGFIRCGKFLSCMGNDVTLVGPSGSGHAMKALNNMLSAIGFAAAAEVLAIGAKMGLDPRVMLKVLNRSSGSNNATQAKIEKFVLSRKFDSGFALSLMLKDLRTAVDLAHETMTPIPIGASCLEEWIAAGSTMPNNADHTHIAAYIEAQAGVKLQ
jgi:3-hydroxyisobutyrate dehydrogenase